MNLFSWRATDPRELLSAEVDHRNDEYIVGVARHAELVVAAWGGPYSPKRLQNWIEQRAVEVDGMLEAHGITLACLAQTKDDHPRHPLYLPYTLEPRAWVA